MNSPEKMSTAEAASRWRALQTLHLDPPAFVDAAPASTVLPHFVPVDFEVTLLSEQLLASTYDATRPAVFSWLNTLPYLTPGAIESTLSEIANLTAPNSILVCNYPCKDVPVTDHLTDHDLNDRYYANRSDGFCAGVPARIIRARR